MSSFFLESKKKMLRLTTSHSVCHPSVAFMWKSVISGTLTQGKPYCIHPSTFDPLNSSLFDSCDRSTSSTITLSLAPAQLEEVYFSMIQLKSTSMATQHGRGCSQCDHFYLQSFNSGGCPWTKWRHSHKFSHLLCVVLRCAARVLKIHFMMTQSNVCGVLRHDDVCKGGNAHSWG